MSANLQLKSYAELTIEDLRELLLDRSGISKIYALSLIDQNSCKELINEVKLCVYDYRPLVRANAYKALIFAEKDSITDVLQDALRDSNRDAFQAAIELFDAVKKQ